MQLSTITAISPIDGRYHNKTSKLQPLFSEYGLIYHRVIIEIRWLQTLSQHKAITEIPSFSQEANDFLEAIIQNFSEADALAIKELEKKLNHDVKTVEYFIKGKLETHGELKKAKEFVHFACTSEDINNLAYALMLKTAVHSEIYTQLDKVCSQLKAVSLQHADQAMLALTHGQPATPTTVGKEFANILSRLNQQITTLKQIQFLGKINGATGNFNAHIVAYPEINWIDFSEQFISSLGLHVNQYTTQIEPHDYIAEICHCLSRVNTIFIDFNRDVWGYISRGYFGQKSISGEIGSSTMPHKINPIDFENSEGNLGLANAMLNHFAEKLPISRWQRDLSDSTVLRNLGVALAYCLIAYQSTFKGLDKLSIHKANIESDLASHWEILAEPIQTVMRRYGLENPYEQLKTLTRGKAINKEVIQDFISGLDIPDKAKQILSTLSPERYIGLSHMLARNIVKSDTSL